MAIPISEATLGAFAAKAAAQESRDFVVWWAQRRDKLGQLDPTQADNFLSAARSEAQDLGIENNDENRIFVMAAVMRLLPKPMPKQEILAIDAVFRHASDDERIAELIAIAQGAG